MNAAIQHQILCKHLCMQNMWLYVIFIHVPTAVAVHNIGYD